MHHSPLADVIWGERVDHFPCGFLFYSHILFITVLHSSTEMSIIEPSLIFSTPASLTLNESRMHVPLNFIDDDIALEDPEAANLSLTLHSRSSCKTVEFSPLSTAKILLQDDDGR